MAWGPTSRLLAGRSLRSSCSPGGLLLGTEACFCKKRAPAERLRARIKRLDWRELCALSKLACKGCAVWPFLLGKHQHDLAEHLLRDGFGTLEGVAPDDATETATLPDGPRLLEDLLVVGF